MILNTSDIADCLFGKAPPGQELSVVPAPDEARFRSGSGASIDLHLGRWFRTLKQSKLPVLKLGGSTPDTPATKEHFVPFDDEFVLHPGKFVLGITLEWLTLPGKLAGHVTGKSSLGRRGLIIETAAGIHPGFAGGLTLELANVGEIPIALKPGMPICQIFLHRTISSNSNATSQFKGSRKPSVGAA